MKTQIVNISDIAEINPRLPLGLSEDKRREVDFVPMSQLSEAGRIEPNGSRPIGEVLKGYTYFANGDVIVAKITPCMENGKAAYVDGLPHGIAFGSTEFHVLRPGPQVDGRYLFYMVWNPFFRSTAEGNMTGSAGQKRVPTKFFDRFQIPLPQLPEQKRIADILDKADAIRRKRQEVLSSIDQIVDAAFMQIVGPDADGFAGWPNEELQSLAATHKGAMRTGPFGSTLRHSEFIDSGIAVLGIDNAVKNRFVWGERRFIAEEKYEDLKQYTVYPGDVLITIMGTNGRSAVVPDDIPLSINTKHLACVTLDRKKAEPEFVSHAIHRHPIVLQQFGKSGRGAIMTGLNLGIIKAIRIPTPPLDTQKEFTKVLKRTRDLEHQIERAADDAENLFNSLVQRAFKGDL